ncbi:uncharacterized protein LOC131664081 [Phymastichus coffea]|uniref:uncharacterized protein LOC131664081 n=1 Tax=Phymastichus coffea TaxID=108790 RepID=UPI00273B0CDE|nr:uncharacterized protein LOC131664081 [Phymastichus coffea]
MLAHPVPGAPISIVVDASDFAIGGALQQRVNNAWQPLAFYTKFLTQTERKYMVEGRNFTIFTDHKPITYAFQQNLDKCSPRQFRYLDYISQFTTDIRHIKDSENCVADALSRVEAIASSVDHDSLASAQKSDLELRELLSSKISSLKLKKVYFPDYNVHLYCDTTSDVVRPYVPLPLRRAVFNSLHCLSHPGTRASQQLVTSRFVWPNINKNWFRYCLTCVDRFSRWPEVVPLSDMEANTVAKALLSTWIARFGVPARITTDQGRQFESALFAELCNLLGTKRIRSTSYHPQANGQVERVHRQLKAAIRCHDGNDWVSILPVVLLGMRSALKEDLGATAAELNLATTSYVFLRYDAVRGPSDPPYDGPYKVLERNDKSFVIDINDKKVRVSIDKLKPAFIVSDDIENNVNNKCNRERYDEVDYDITVQRNDDKVTPPIRVVPPPVNAEQHNINCNNNEAPVNVQQPCLVNNNRFTTRSGRNVHFPDRYQAGFL